jgi:hypothetical protein
VGELERQTENFSEYSQFPGKDYTSGLSKPIDFNRSGVTLDLLIGSIAILRTKARHVFIRGVRLGRAATMVDHKPRSLQQEN